jgi:hypothetical protein
MHDVGIGIRVAFLGGLVVRTDVAHGLTDGKNAISIGLNQAF